MIILGQQLTWMWLVILALATFRLARFVTADTFPGWTQARSRILDRWPPRPGATSELLACPWCCSVWLAAGLLVWWLLSPATLAPFALIVALSAVAGLLAEWGGG
jgi:hypothetical protein